MKPKSSVVNGNCEMDLSTSVYCIAFVFHESVEDRQPGYLFKPALF